jgi:hypothetical protein
LEKVISCGICDEVEKAKLLSTEKLVPIIFFSTQTGELI